MLDPEEYKKKAIALFKEGHNCAQAVVSAFSDITRLPFETGMKVASSFGGGMARLREVCGAVTGMFMVAGLIYGYDSPIDKISKTAHYQLIQDLAQEFKDANGSIVCRELLGLTNKIDSPVPDERTKEYYKKRPCAELVGMAAEILAKKINKIELEEKDD